MSEWLIECMLSIYLAFLFTTSVPIILGIVWLKFCFFTILYSETNTHKRLGSRIWKKLQWSYLQSCVFKWPKQKLIKIEGCSCSNWLWGCGREIHASADVRKAGTAQNRSKRTDEEHGAEDCRWQGKSCRLKRSDNVYQPESRVLSKESKVPLQTESDWVDPFH